MNWFKRHLNWTYVLGYIAVFVFCFIVGFVLAVVDPYVSDEVLDVVGYSICIIVLFPLSVWTLKMKNRSQWWLLLAGWLSPLWLSSKERE